jgi:uncharacterized protein YjbI with pentapeptide repeats
MLSSLGEILALCFLLIMKAKDIVELYANGQRNFQGYDLRGFNFKGQDLSEADFTEADIRGTNFAQAFLKKTKFVRAKAGVQKRWLLFQHITALILTFFISVFILSSYVKGVIEDLKVKEIFLHLYGLNVFDQKAVKFIGSLRGTHDLVTLGVTILTVSLLGFTLRSFAIVFMINLLDSAFLFWKVSTAHLSLPFIPLSSFSIQVSSPIAFVVLGAVAPIFLILTIACLSASIGIAPVSFFIWLPILIFLIKSQFFTGFFYEGLVSSWKNYLTHIGAVINEKLFLKSLEKLPLDFIDLTGDYLIFLLLIYTLSFYASWQAFKKHENFELIRCIGVTLGSVGGTSFAKADLTESNFTETILARSNFNQATITPDSLNGSLKLSYARIDDSLVSVFKANKNVFSKVFSIFQRITMNNIDQSKSEVFQIHQERATIGNSAGKVSDQARQQANQYNYHYSSEHQKTLAESARDIQQLLKQLEQANPTATEEEKIAYVDDETTPSFKRRVVGALQSGSEAAIEEIFDNPYINVGKAVVKGWIKPE